MTVKMAEADRVKKKLSAPNTNRWNEQMHKMRVFDNLIYNTDRHLNNILITEDFQIRLIDHSRSFRIFDKLQTPKTLTRFSKLLLEKMETLTEPLLQEHMGAYLSPAQIRAILKRRDLILMLARDLVKQKGEATVLYP
jgi:predicted nucleotidyltransferase